MYSISKSREIAKEYARVYEEYSGESITTHVILSKKIVISHSKEKQSAIALEQMMGFYRWRMANGRFKKDPMTDEDFDKLKLLNADKNMALRPMAAVLGISGYNFHLEYAKLERKDLKTAYQATLALDGSHFHRKVTYKGETRHIKGWADLIGITSSAFQQRLRKFGVAPISFMSKKEYAALPRETIDACRQDVENGMASQYGNRVNWDRVKLERNDKYVTYERCANLVAAIIEDSKRNLRLGVRGKNGEEYVDSSRRFLCDANGQLSYYLDVIDGVDRTAAKAELKEYALSGYKTAHL